MGVESRLALQVRDLYILPERIPHLAFVCSEWMVSKSALPSSASGIMALIASSCL